MLFQFLGVYLGVEIQTHPNMNIKRNIIFCIGEPEEERMHQQAETKRIRNQCGLTEILCRNAKRVQGV